MARPKKQLKAKEPIKIRFKELANGSKSIYLDIYYQGKRSYEFIKMYLVPEVDKSSREKNQNTLQCAEAIKAQRIKDLYNGVAGLQKNGFEKMRLADFLQIYKDYKQKNKQSRTVATGIRNMIAKMQEYNSTATLKDVDKAFCLGYIEHLRTAKNKRQTKGEEVQICLTTARGYYKAFTSALNWGVRKGYLKSNPCDLLDKDEKIKAQKTQICYLTQEEVQKLEAEPCVNDRVKQTYLFACFCGLRFSDVSTLTWGEVKQGAEKTTIQTVMEKTKEAIYLPLIDAGLKWLPARPEGAKDTDKVFDRLPSLQYTDIVLKQWALGAGINKKVTFHTSRHTYATLLLIAGADLYTVSKLLGHKDIKTTTIYAQVIDKTKDKAVSKLNDLFK